MKNLKFKSFPKINIGLNINKLINNDSKHTIESLFMMIDDYYDEIEMIESDKNKVIYISSINNFEIIDDNVIKGLEYLRNFHNLNKYYKVIITKNIPMKAGLGGSSSNVGMIINKICSINNIILNESDFKYISLNIGSDVVFFIKNYSLAMVYEYGNIVEEVRTKKKLNYELLANNFSIDTKEAFSYFDKNVDDDKTNYKLLLKNWPDINNIKIINNLLNPILKSNKFMNQYYKENSENQKIILTGSGSFFFKIKDSND